MAAFYLHIIDILCRKDRDYHTEWAATVQIELLRNLHSCENLSIVSSASGGPRPEGKMNEWTSNVKDKTMNFEFSFPPLSFLPLLSLTAPFCSACSLLLYALVHLFRSWQSTSVQALRELEQRGANSGLAVSRPGQIKDWVPSQKAKLENWAFECLFFTGFKFSESPVFHQSHQPSAKSFTKAMKKVSKMHPTNLNAVT